MVNQEAIQDLEGYCRSIMSDEMMLQWKRNFNKMADKASKSGDWMDSNNVASKDKDMQFLYYKLEVLEPFTRYWEVFGKLGIPIPADPFEGYPEAR